MIGGKKERRRCRNTGNLEEIWKRKKGDREEREGGRIIKKK